MSETTEPVQGQGTTPAKMGRPTTFSQETADELCEYLSIGESLRTACSHDGMPVVRTVFNWFRAYPDFLQQYTRAKEEAADAMAEDILDISDDATNDYMMVTGKDGDERYQLNGEHIQRSRLRVESRKWLMAKMKPKKYGEKVDVTTGGDKINRGMDTTEIDAALARYEASKAGATQTDELDDTDAALARAEAAGQ